MKKIQSSAHFLLIAILLCAVFILFIRYRLIASMLSGTGAAVVPLSDESAIEVVSGSDGNYIKWVDFKITCDALSKAYTLDVESYDKDIHLNWIELLAYAGAKCGGSFDKSSLSLIDKLAAELSGGETTIEKLTENMDYYEYYYEAYEAVLGGMVGEYEIEQDDGNGNKVWKKVYGLKAFSPIAKGFEYSDYDDFGSSRSYGYKRQHLGHDMMGQIGTPIRIKNGILFIAATRKSFVQSIIIVSLPTLDYTKLFSYVSANSILIHILSRRNFLLSSIFSISFLISSLYSSFVFSGYSFICIAPFVSFVLKLYKNKNIYQWVVFLHISSF